MILVVCSGSGITMYVYPDMFFFFFFFFLIEFVFVTEHTWVPLACHAGRV